MSELNTLLRSLDVRQEDIDEATSLAEQTSVRIAQVLVERNFVGEEAFAEAVASAANTVVIDLRHGEIDREMVRVIPRELASRYLALPLAVTPGGDCLRVAMVDPLDEAALTALGQVSQLAIEPLVATLSELQEALGRAYRHSPSTQRLVRPEWEEFPSTSSGPHTVPSHRLESEATAEQRHQALLLALIDAGVVTREGYMTTLQRLLVSKE